MKLLIGLLVVILASSFCFADSDSTGILRGSTEKLSILLTNSTGSFDNSSNCTISITEGGSTVLVDYVEMANEDRGAYSYSWAVPDDVGTYWMAINCSTSALENYTDGGSMLVVDKLLEKTVGSGVAKYEDRYREQYEVANATAASILSFGWLDVSLGAGVLIIIVLILYFGYKKR
jgi:hypothetical protein